jgi:hypothetical protein
MREFLANHVKHSSFKIALIFTLAGGPLWEHKNGRRKDLGPYFSFLGSKHEDLAHGKYYELFGVSVWIYDFVDLLLKSQSLTTKKVMRNGLRREIFIIENVPEGFPNSVLNPDGCCCSMRSKNLNVVKKES